MSNGEAARGEIPQPEDERARENKAREAEYCYEVHGGGVQFTDEAREKHRKLRLKPWKYVIRSRFFVLISSPVIWMCAIPIALADVIGTLYQAICFPIYGIPKVRRRDYLAFDRHHLAYLNFFEKVNCEYCAYVNGILGVLHGDRRQDRAALVPDQARRMREMRAQQVQEIHGVRRRGDLPRSSSR